MHFSLSMVKRFRRPVVTTAGRLNPSRRLFIMDQSSKSQWLIDTGADVSVYPVSKMFRRPKSDYLLYAANGSPISTYGTIPLRLDLKLKKTFDWRFLVANVEYPILGAD